MRFIRPALAVFLLAGPASAADDSKAPYFVSLKADEVYMREGPSKEHRIKWIYHRKGLPVEVVAVFDVWRRVRDMDGEVGWVHRSMLSPSRTALVVGKGEVTLRGDPSPRADAIAQVETGAIGDLRRCHDSACELSFGNADGWIDRGRLWGVYAGEDIH